MIIVVVKAKPRKAHCIERVRVEPKTLINTILKYKIGVGFQNPNLGIS